METGASVSVTTKTAKYEECYEELQTILSRMKHPVTEA